MNKLFISGVALLATVGIVAPSLASAEQMMTNTGASASAMVSESDLMLGGEGDNVVWLQNWLETKGYLVMPQGVAKGYFGKLTKRALMTYQGEVGLPSTGYFGPLTRAKLKATVAMMKDDGVMVGGALMIRTRDIVDNAVLANNVTTVVAAVKAADLVGTLKSAGPFTVFAPNNYAFLKLPAGTVDTLLKPENKSQLVDILTYHVVSGRYKSSDLTDGLVLKTVEGKTLKFHRDASGKLSINGTAMVETADVISTNGVTHVIDTVLLPK